MPLVSVVIKGGVMNSAGSKWEKQAEKLEKKQLTKDPNEQAVTG